MAETQAQEHPPEQTPPRFELEQTDEYSRFLLYSKSEILFVLRSLIQKEAMITVYFDQGKSFLLTSLLAITEDGNELIFDASSNEEMNRKAIVADKLLFTTAIDRVKVQFSLNKLSPATHDGYAALRGPLPETLLRLQRREYFRLSTPIATPVKCAIPMRRADGSSLVMEAPLLDISGGGVGLMVTPDQTSFYARDAIFKDCKIALTDEGMLVATLSVRNTFHVTTKSGAHYTLVGCEFVELPGPRLSMIQRYITRVERERKARLSGMA